MTSPPGVEAVDHVLGAVGDPAAAAARLRDRYGWGCVPGPPLFAGMGSLLVPLSPPQHLRLVYPADPDLITGSPWGAWLTGMRPDELRLIGWAVTTDDAERCARRLGAEPIRQAMFFDAGEVWSWRAVADTRSFASLPFFVQYDGPPAPRLSRLDRLYLAARHSDPPGAVRAVRINADPDRAVEWFAGLPAWLTIGTGPPGLVSVTVGTGLPGDAGRTVLGDPFRLPDAQSPRR